MTRDDFLSAADTYRAAGRRYFFLGFPLFFICAVLPGLLLFTLSHLHLVSKEQVSPIIAAIWIYWILLVICFPRFVLRQASKEAGLFCVSCSKAAKQSDLARISAKNNCPYCGHLFYN